MIILGYVEEERRPHADDNPFMHQDAVRVGLVTPVGLDHGSSVRFRISPISEKTEDDGKRKVYIPNPDRRKVQLGIYGDREIVMRELIDLGLFEWMRQEYENVALFCDELLKAGIIDRTEST